MCVRFGSDVAWDAASGSTAGAAARREAAGEGATDAVSATAAAGGAETARSATDLGSYFLVRFKSTSLTIALSVSWTPIPVVATDS